MKILVTGGAGFIGSTIVDAYIEAGHKVWALDDESSGRRQQVNRQARFVRGDVRDAAKLRRLFQQHRFDVVNHHAAQIDVRRSVENPVFDAEVNIVGILNVLVECRRHKVKKFMFSSSGGTVYGECPKPAKESSPEIPLSPYGVAKLSSEKYIRAFGGLYGLPFTIFRYANVFGPRQDPHGEAGVVAIFSNKLLNKTPAVIFGDGKQVRDFVYVKDVARASVLALKKANGEIINIGTGKRTSVRELYAAMARLTRQSTPAIYKPARTGELQESVLDISKARRVLGWAPLTTLNQGLQETLDYFSERLAR